VPNPLTGAEEFAEVAIKVRLRIGAACGDPNLKNCLPTLEQHTACSGMWGPELEKLLANPGAAYRL
jgi:hypothetical protein